MGQVHTLDPTAWGGTDDSVELGFSGSQIHVPISQPFTILEIPKNLKCDEQNNLRAPPRPPPPCKMSTSLSLECTTLRGKGDSADEFK